MREDSFAYSRWNALSSTRCQNLQLWLPNICAFGDQPGIAFVEADRVASLPAK
jgi:hypothetical protein